MDTKVIHIEKRDGNPTEEEEEALKEAGNIIKSGGLVAFPTETVYGLGGDAMNPDSSRKIYAAKGRPSDNPLIVHIAEREALERVAIRIPKEASILAETFWPGPLTMILEKAKEVPKETTGGLDTVAVRMPSNRTAQRLIRYGGGFVAAPSANLSGKPSPTSAAYVKEDMMGRIDMIIDGGDGEIGLESTIVDLTVNPPQILRPGYITADMLERALDRRVDMDDTILRGDSGKAPRAPGMKYRHYAPKGEMTIVSGGSDRVVEYINRQSKADQEKGEKTGVIATKEQMTRYHAGCVKVIGSRQDEEAIARNLYRILREFDDEEVTRIYSESFEAEGVGQAVMNRLLKAAGHHVVKV